MCHCMNNFASQSVYHQNFDVRTLGKQRGHQYFIACTYILHYITFVFTNRCKCQIARRFSQPLVMYSTTNDAQNGPNTNDPSTAVEWIIGTDGAWCRKLEHCIKPLNFLCLILSIR